MPASSGYPATLTFDAPERVANWRPLVHWLMAIPHFIVLYFLNIASSVVAIVSWFIIVFSGQMSPGLANFQAMYIRYAARVYNFAAFLREEYPPFSFDATTSDPGDDPRLRVDLQPQLTDRNRVTTFFRFILVIPVAIVLAIFMIGAYITVLIAFFAVLFTGHWPAGLRDFVIKVQRFAVRLMSYSLLLTDKYPPFALD